MKLMAVSGSQWQCLVIRGPGGGGLRLCSRRREPYLRLRQPIIRVSTCVVYTLRRTYGICACIKLVQETLVPGIDAVLEDLLNDGKQTLLTLTLVGQRELDAVGYLLGLLEVDKNVILSSSCIGNNVTRSPLRSGIIGSLDKGYNKGTNSLDKLLIAMCQNSQSE